MPAACPAPFNLAHYVLNTALADPSKVALRICGSDGEHLRELTYGALQDQVAKTASALKKEGVVSGDRVILRLGNHHGFPICFLAAIWIGACPVPTSAQLTEDEVSAISRTCRPKAVIYDEDIARPKDVALQIETKTILGAGEHSALQPVFGDPERPAYIVFTSGTSGRPVGVVHAHRAVWARRMMWQDWYGLRQGDVMLHAGALNWTYTLGTGLLDPWTCGATAIVAAKPGQPRELLRVLKEEAVTIFAAVPGVYRKLLELEMPDLPALRHGLSAGEKLAEPVRQAWIDATGTDIHEAFGMTECSTFISGSPDRPAPTGTLGYPQTGRGIRLSENGQIMIHHSDPGLMIGYLDERDGTKRALSEGYFVTEDQAHQRPDGAIEYLGRTDDVITAQGYRVSPSEVEGVIGQSDAVDDCTVVQFQRDLKTTLIAAICVGDADKENSVRQHCAAGLAKYKQPHIYEWVDALPRNANNKLSRRSLREELERRYGQT